MGNSVWECKIQLASSQRSSGQTASVTPVTGWNSQLTVLSTPKEGLRPPFALGSIILPLSFRPWLHDDSGRRLFQTMLRVLDLWTMSLWSVAVLDHAELCLMAYESVIGGCFRSCSECLMADESVIGGCFISYCECLTTDESVIGGCFRSCCEYLMSA